jgi:AcrR family transcriptional regulator
MVERVLQATAVCVERLGLDKTTVDEIVQASGLSRATIYRRFGHREAIFEALLISRSHPHVASALRLLSAPGSMAQRLESSLVYALMEIGADPCLNTMYRADWTAANVKIIRGAFFKLLKGNMAPVLQAAYDAGELRQDLPFQELMFWQLDQYRQMAALGPWEPERLRHHIRHFILPVMVPDAQRGMPPPDQARPVPMPAAEVAHHMEEIQTQLAEMQSRMGRLRQTLLGG